MEHLYEIERDGVRREKTFSIDTDGFVVVEEVFKGQMTKTFILN